MLSDLKLAFRHTSIYGAANIAKKGIAFLMIPVYTHFLTPAEYGLVELFDLFLEVTLILFGARISEALLRFYHHYDTEKDRNEVFSTALIFAVAIGIGLGSSFMLLSRTLAKHILGSAAEYSYFRFLAFCVPFYLIVMVPDYYLLARKESVRYSKIGVFNLLLSLSLNILFIVFMRLGIWGLLYSMLITKIVNLVILLYLVLPTMRLRFSWKKLWHLLRFGLPLVPGTLGIFVIHFSDRFFVRRFCTGDDLGIYSLGYKFGMVISFLLAQPFFAIWNTQRFEVAKREDGRDVIGRMFTYYLLVVVLAGLGISIFAKEIVEIMAPNRYRKAADIIPLITASYILYSIANYTNTGIMIAYRTHYVLIANVAAALLNVFLNYILVGRFGIMGAAVSSIVTSACLVALTFSLAQAAFYVKYEYARTTALASMAAAAFFCASLVQLPVVASVGVKGAIFVLTPVLLGVLGFFTEEEKRRGHEVIGSVRRLIAMRGRTIV